MGLNPIRCFSPCFHPSKSDSGAEESQRLFPLGMYGRLYSYKELSAATRAFHPSNKIGQGGFGSVFKGKLKDGTLVAVKVLSIDNKQGEKEFVSEIAAISNIRHENLVVLYGCCTDGTNRMLVYGYMENQCIFQRLFADEGHGGISFNWIVRRNICLGVARGLAFLHEQIEPYIVHRDIKASNILLDGSLNPKISDFGFAKLFPDNTTHISTCVAGTLGYLAPEYAINGKLTRKADTYSFGVLLLEIVSGICITKTCPAPDEGNLVEMAWGLYKSSSLSELVDPKLNVDNNEEPVWFLKIALLCVQKVPSLRPKMSAVVDMFINKSDSGDIQISEPAFLIDLNAIRVARGESSQTPNSKQTSLFSSKSIA